MPFSLRRPYLGFSRPAPRRRGQTMVEFAMVAPLLFLIIASFFFLGAWSFNLQGMRHAAGVGASEGNDQTLPISLRFANDSRLTTVYLGWNNSSVPACRRSLVSVGRADYRRNLGWDWGCVYSLATADGINPAMQAAADAAYRRISTSGFFIGNPNRITITVCLATISADSATVCAYSGTATGGGTLAFSAPSSNYAPSFIEVTMSTPAQMQVGPWEFGAMQVRTIHALSRFLPPCPAEDAAQVGSAYTLNQCGGLQ